MHEPVAHHLRQRPDEDLRRTSQHDRIRRPRNFRPEPARAARLQYEAREIMLRLHRIAEPRRHRLRLNAGKGIPGLRAAAGILSGVQNPHSWRSAATQSFCPEMNAQPLFQLPEKTPLALL